MKYCPNRECPFLDAVGTIAEYEDRIDICPECNTELVSGKAPAMLTPDDEAQLADNVTMQTVVTVDSEEEAEWIKDELEQMRIAAKIVATEPDAALSENEMTVDEEVSFFDVRVLAHHVVPAMNVIGNLMDDDELEDDEFEDEFDDEFDNMDEDDLEEEDDSLNDEDWELAESDSAEVTGMGNNFLMIVMVALFVLLVGALIYGLLGY